MKQRKRIPAPSKGAGKAAAAGGGAKAAGHERRKASREGPRGAAKPGTHKPGAKAAGAKSVAKPPSVKLAAKAGGSKAGASKAGASRASARAGAAKPSTKPAAAKPAARPAPGGASKAPARPTRPKAKPAPRPAKRRPQPRVADSAFRLNPEIRPSDYRIHILPELQQGKFRGEVVIELDLKRAIPSIELHAAELTVDHAEVAYPDVPEPSPTARLVGRAVQAPPGLGPIALPQKAVAIVPHAARETVEIKFLRPLAPGHVKLSLAYHGTLQERLRGLYKASSGGRRYAFTQLEAADARRFFPCFDEPEFKARFTFWVTAEAGLTVISNGPLERTDRNAYGGATRQFRTTPKLSTYLCALAVGELEGSPERLVGRTPVRVWHVPGKSALTGFALEAAVESLRRLEAYFDLPYPYEKLDLVAVPDFEAGAMENVGAVFFRETLLLVDPATITVAERKRVAEVIAHELAHMWFGNLVTMHWWDDLWLNEAFATWMAFKIVDEWKPEWRMWNNFEPHRAAALALDALANTHPIYAEVENAAQATENFDAITYEKGASVVRMIEHYLGAAKFRAGVRRYIRRHREGSAVAADLWKALEEASGHPVAQIVKSWIRQPGFPLVGFSVEEREGTAELTVKQERFLASPVTRVPKGTPTTWPVPLVVHVCPRAGAPVRTERALVRTARARIALPGGKPPAWIYGNAAEGGFYRPLHDEASLAALAADLGGALAPVERMGLVGHQWAIVRAGRASLKSFLDLASKLGGETDYEVLDTLAGALAFIDDQLADTVGPEGRPALQAWLGGTFAAAWRELGWEPAPGESEERKLRRASVLRIRGLLGEDPGIAQEASERLERYLADRTSLEPNLAEPLIAIAARDGGVERFERLRAAVGEARTPQERRRFQLALADFHPAELARRALDLSLTPEVPTQDVAFLLMRLLGNRFAREATWQFIQHEWERLARRLPPMMAARLIESTSALQSREHRREVATFFRAHPVETGARALRLALERFDVNEELRRRASKDLRSWLAARRPPGGPAANPSGAGPAAVPTSPAAPAAPPSVVAAVPADTPPGPGAITP